MWTNIGVDKCVSFLESQFRPQKRPTGKSQARPAITISRTTGAGGHAVASPLAEYLRMRVPGHLVWTVFDENLVQKVLEDHRMQKYIAAFVEEGHKSMLQDSIEEWMGLHPGSWTVLQWTNAAVARLAQAGNVIMLGRGGMVITGKMENVFHVRLVGSLERRIERVKEIYGLDQKQAAAYIKKKDEGRRKYLKDNFDEDIDNPLLYHLTVNTDLAPYEETAGLIGEAVFRRFNLGRQAKGAKAEVA